MIRDIRSWTRDELAEQLAGWGEPPYRVDQLLRWLYARRVADWEAMTNLPKALRGRLRGEHELRLPTLLRVQGTEDTTRKFLWRLADGALIESVLLPATPALFGDASDRRTLCLSTQVGCACGCRFCASGLDGWKRNLGVEEIVGQVIATERWLEESAGEAAETAEPGRCVDNLVIMGMGEPLANLDCLLRALEILNAPWGGGIGARKITVSTSGLAPEIRRLADQPLQLGLAVSLHGATNEVRSRLMPINRKYPLRELIAACGYYRQKQGRRITLEYVLIAGVNDDLRQVPPLAGIAHRLKAKVNLIPYNTVPGLSWRRPEPERQEAFRAALEAERIPVTLRREKGHDIDAACGQLRLRTERALEKTTSESRESSEPEGPEI